MKLVLLQQAQNSLYDFREGAPRRARADAAALGAQMLEQTFDLLSRVARADLVVTTEAVTFPGLKEKVEGAYAGLVPSESDPLFERFADEARRMRSYLVVCAYVARGGRLFNTALVYDRDGNRVARYDKIHLAGGEKSCLTPGDALCVVEADFGRFGVCICWDMQFPEVCRSLALMGARLVVCPTWGWEAVYAHARAYENGVFVAGAMSVPYWMPIEGIRTPSQVVAPWGEVLACAPRDTRHVLACDIDLSMAETYRASRLADRRPETYGMLTRPISD